MVRKLSRNWTDNQKKAIEARNMQILVSAAAGSGKTSVLTERVKRILCDTENPCAVSEILVVTFTRAAANEMRDRIYKALGDEIENNNENSDYLRRQMTLLPTADICTMDSFCAKLVRENFHLADVGADFKILDEKDEKELMKYAVKDVVDGLYEENEPEIEKAVRAASGVDYIILCIGENSYCETPGNLDELALSENQIIIKEFD